MSEERECIQQAEVQDQTHGQCIEVLTPCSIDEVFNIRLHSLGEPISGANRSCSVCHVSGSMVNVRQGLGA